MAYIWLLIIAGVIIVPIISGAVKELEKKLEKTDQEASLEAPNKKKQRIQDTKFAIKFLTYTVALIFLAIVIVMAVFTSKIIYSN